MESRNQCKNLMQNVLLAAHCTVLSAHTKIMGGKRLSIDLFHLVFLFLAIDATILRIKINIKKDHH
jgi:hypothetical protein